MGTIRTELFRRELQWTWRWLAQPGCIGLLLLYVTVAAGSLLYFRLYSLAGSPYPASIHPKTMQSLGATWIWCFRTALICHVLEARTLAPLTGNRLRDLAVTPLAARSLLPSFLVAPLTIGLLMHLLPWIAGILVAILNQWELFPAWERVAKIRPAGGRFRGDLSGFVYVWQVYPFVIGFWNVSMTVATILIAGGVAAARRHRLPTLIYYACICGALFLLEQLLIQIILTLFYYPTSFHVSDFLSYLYILRHLLGAGIFTAIGISAYGRIRSISLWQEIMRTAELGGNSS